MDRLVSVTSADSDQTAPRSILGRLVSVNSADSDQTAPRVFGQTGFSKQCRLRSDCSYEHLGRLVPVNSSDSEQSDQGLHCLSHHLHLLDA